MTVTDTQLLVVGAGPAGAAAAITAADRGLDVIVVDKARFPRDKTCGDGLTTAALRLLEGLGVTLGDLVSYMPVHEVVLVGPDGRQVVLPIPHDGEHAGVVPRFELDAALVALARRAGAEIREGSAVESLAVDDGAVKVVLANGTALHARHVVAADGHYSTVRRLLGPGSPDLGTFHAFRQYFRGVDDPRLWVLFEGDLLPGYAWVFPLPDGRANVGFGVLRRPGLTGKQLKRLWAELLDRPGLRAILGPAAEPEATQRAWPIPAELDVDGLTHGPVVFAGDAARVVDPLTGEGIAQALETGVLAAESVAALGDAATVAARYRRAVQRSLAPDLRFARSLQWVLASRTRTRLALRAVDLNDWSRANFARWMFEAYPRALVLTPRRWHRHALHEPGAYRA